MVKCVVCEQEAKENKRKESEVENGFVPLFDGKGGYQPACFFHVQKENHRQKLVLEGSIKEEVK
jgi:hypothetical protein